MATERRIGSESSETRKRLLDIAERLMLDEGYAAVTSRRVASLAGVNPALVHYYFPVTDDLFLAIWRRGAERTLDRHRAATQAPQPLRAMWKLSRETRGTGLVMEFAALANHPRPSAQRSPSTAGGIVDSRPKPSRASSPTTASTAPR